jgi:hypothetical protein
VWRAVEGGGENGLGTAGAAGLRVVVPIGFSHPTLDDGAVTDGMTEGFC